jgi:hypothetical protein
MTSSPNSPHLASPNGGLPSSVLWAQLILKDRLRAGDVVVDATMGNGHDTLFLTQCVSPGGHVFAFDVQEAALIETRKRVPAEMTTLIHAGHETMRAHVPVELHGKVSAGDVQPRLPARRGQSAHHTHRNDDDRGCKRRWTCSSRAACSRSPCIRATKAGPRKAATWPNGPPRSILGASRCSTCGR